MTAMNAESFEPFSRGKIMPAFMRVVGKMVGSIVKIVPGGQH
ncbi:MAG TPA: hypothetical protein VIM53_02665 [Candidatus Saccharimonadales bacterium]